MFSNLNASDSISFIIVFLEGILSFFSPCILPLLPLYITYLSGNTKKVLPDGSIIYDRKKVFFHTLCFTFGICCTFFILGLSFNKISSFLYEYKYIFTKIGGIIIILLGLFQIGFLNFKFLQKERKINFDMSKKEVNPFVAFLMGLTFSFSWTPCVGPALASVLILASSGNTPTNDSSFLVHLEANLLIAIYSIGFVIPFLLLGLFTSKALNFFQKNQKFVKYTVKISGALLILIGIMTFTGFMNTISSYLNIFTSKSPIYTSKEKNVEETTLTEATTEATTEEVVEDSKTTTQELVDAFDFTLTDQYGNTHTLSDYKGKVVFLNFWATWCKPCLIEMPHIEELYKEYGLNKEDVIILGIANPRSKEYPQNADVPKDEILQFIEDKGYTFPILFDETGDVYYDYLIRSFPTTFMVDKNGKLYGYVTGSLTKDVMKNIINQTLDSTKDNTETTN